MLDIANCNGNLICRKCAPRLSAEAAEKLSSYYVGIRSDVQKMEMNTTERSSIPITIRYLRSVIL